MKKIFPLLFLSATLMIGCSASNPGENDPGNHLPEINYYWPEEEISNFLSEKGVINLAIPQIEIREEDYVGFTVNEDEYTYASLIVKGNQISTYQAALEEASFSYDLTVSLLTDSSKQIAISLDYQSPNTVINFYAYVDLIEIEPEPDPEPEPVEDYESLDIDLAREVAGDNSINSSNISGASKTFDNKFVISFAK